MRQLLETVVENEYGAAPGEAAGPVVLKQGDRVLKSMPAYDSSDGSHNAEPGQDDELSEYEYANSDSGEHIDADDADDAESSAPESTGTDSQISESRFGRKRTQTQRMNCDKMGMSVDTGSVYHVTENYAETKNKSRRSSVGKRNSAFSRMVCFLAAAIDMRCDVGCVDEADNCMPAPVWAIKKVTWDSPASYRATRKREDCDKWEEAWNLERSNMERLGVLEQCDWPEDGSNVCGSTLVCKIKRLATGLLDKYRVRWVAQGFSQRWGMDFFDTASPVVSTAALRVICAIASCTPNCIKKQFDVPVAFLRTKLNETVYMAAPPGVELPRKNGKRQCFLCKRSIYGLKQSSHGWYNKCSKEMFINFGFKRCPLESCVFIKRQGTKFIIAALFVDDCLYIGNWPEEIQRFERHVNKLYQVEKFEDLNWYLGMKYESSSDGTISVSMKQFVIDALARFGLKDTPGKLLPVPTEFVFDDVDPTCALDSKRQKLYMEKVGTLNYAATTFRDDIAWATSKLGMFMQQADENHMRMADHALLFLKHTQDKVVTYRSSGGLEPVAYSDASFADAGKTGKDGRRRSQSGCAVMLGGVAVVYYSRSQKNVALSTAESEYVALSQCVQEVIWVRRLLHFLGFPPQGTTVVYEDNEAAQALANNESMTKKSRFVDVRYHYTREMVQEGEVKVVRCDTANMTADLYTKAMNKVLLSRHGEMTSGATASSVTPPVLSAIIGTEL